MQAQLQLIAVLVPCGHTLPQAQSVLVSWQWYRSIVPTGHHFEGKQLPAGVAMGFTGEVTGEHPLSPLHIPILLTGSGLWGYGTSHVLLPVQSLLVVHMF